MHGQKHEVVVDPVRAEVLVRTLENPPVRTFVDVRCRQTCRKDDEDFDGYEAFASVVLAWIAETGADPASVNANGDAIALGHPVGASRGRLTATLLATLEERRGRYGLQVMCESGGTANATLFGRLPRAVTLGHWLPAP